VSSSEQPHSRIVEEHGPLVWRTLCRLLRAEDDAIDDCFQETFLEFLRQSSDGVVERPAGLLVRIATRRAIDRIRIRAGDRARLRSLDESDAAADATDPSVAVMGDELAQALRLALIDLPEQQSAVFVMTQLEQMSHDDVAVALGVSLNHVAVLLFRARATLQAKLKNVISAERR
jgi:RNA polymerase sigma-70 factor (ECF subfamily)